MERASRVPVPRTVLPLVDVPKIRLLQHELLEEMLSRHGSQFGDEDEDHVELLLSTCHGSIGYGAESGN